MPESSVGSSGESPHRAARSTPGEKAKAAGRVGGEQGRDLGVQSEASA